MARRLLIILIIMLIASPALTQAPATLPALPETRGKKKAPVQLFNGKDLSGWVWYTDPATKVEETWTVKDGILSGKGSPRGYLRTEKDQGPDYILTVEYRHVERTGAGGILFGIFDTPDKIWPKVMKVQMEFGNVGEVINQGDFNWFVDNNRYVNDHLKRMAPTSEKPFGEWNTLHLIIDRTEVVVIVNDVIQNTASGISDITGKIALQSDGAKIEFRRIQLTPLD